MNTSSFAATPRVLADTVRNVVIGRAMAGAYDVHETPRQAVQACRAAARQKLNVGRLNPAQAAEVDALVTETRASAAQNMNPALRGTMTDAMLQQISAPAAHASSEESETMKAILAALGRVEKLIMMLVTLCFNRALAGKLGGQPQLTDGNVEPMTDDQQLPAWNGRVVQMPQDDVMTYHALPSHSSNAMVLHGAQAPVATSHESAMVLHSKRSS